jgi:hypothetical protein
MDSNFCFLDGHYPLYVKGALKYYPTVGPKKGRSYLFTDRKRQTQREPVPQPV